MTEPTALETKLSAISGEQTRKDKEAARASFGSAKPYESAYYTAERVATEMKAGDESTVDQIDGYLRVHYCTDNSTIHMLLGDPVEINGKKYSFKYILVQEKSGAEHFVCAAEPHKTLTALLSKSLDSQKGIDYRRKDYEKEYNHWPQCGLGEGSEIQGGLIELKFDEQDKPYLELFGQSGTYGLPEVEKVLLFLNKHGITARHDTARAKNMQP